LSYFTSGNPPLQKSPTRRGFFFNYLTSGCLKC